MSTSKIKIKNNDFKNFPMIPFMVLWGIFFERKVRKRVLKININGQFVTKSAKNAQPNGSSNTAELQFIFDESWLGYAKRVLWRDAKGENLTSVLLVPDIIQSGSVYNSVVPAAVMSVPGWCSFTIEGYFESNPSKIMKSVTDGLFVAYSQTSQGIAEITPSEAMQLQAEFEELLPKVEALMENTRKEVSALAQNLNVWESYDENKLYQKGNKVSYNGRSYVCKVQVYGVSPENEEYWLLISDCGEKGSRGAQGPQGIRGDKGDKGDKGEKGEKGDKGEKGEKGDKGERGINGTTIPIGGFYTFSVDENGDLWVNFPDGGKAPSVSLNESGELILSIEGESLSTYNIGKVKGEKGDKGADGYTPVRGKDYWTEEDKAEIKAYVEEAVLGGEW